MTEIEAAEAILEKWKTDWEDAHPADVSDPDSVPWTTRNESFAPKDLGEIGAWARITVVPTISEQITQGPRGSRKVERRGYVMVQLFAEVNKIRSDDTVIDGDATVKQLAEDVREVLECKDLDGVQLYEGSANPLPEEPSWNRYVVTVPYRITSDR